MGAMQLSILSSMGAVVLHKIVQFYSGFKQVNFDFSFVSDYMYDNEY